MASLRVLALLALIALAGCAGPATLSTPATAAQREQDLQVYAIRVEPFTNAVDWHGELTPRACDPVNSSPCRYPVFGTAANPIGFDVAPQDDLFQESRGLFWRVGLNATWHSDTVARPITMSWAVLKADGSLSREIGNKTSDTGVDFPLRDVFLTPGETGIRLRVDLGDQYPFAIGKGIQFHVQGIVQAFLPASAPVLLS